MAALQVNMKLLHQLLAMDFPFARAAPALHYTSNGSIEEAVNWIIDHENDPDTDQTSYVTFDIDIESPESFIVSEETKKKSKDLRERVQKNEAQEERYQIEQRRRKVESRKAAKEEEKVERENILQKHEKNKESLSSLKTVECMREYLKYIKQNNKDDLNRVRRAFQTLLIYVGNVAKNPADEKFRKIRLTNPLFQERVGSLEGGIAFLGICGFEIYEREFLYLPLHKVDVKSLKSAGFLLNSAISNPFFGILSL